MCSASERGWEVLAIYVCIQYPLSFVSRVSLPAEKVRSWAIDAMSRVCVAVSTQLRSEPVGIYKGREGGGMVCKLVFPMAAKSTHEGRGLQKH